MVVGRYHAEQSQTGQSQVGIVGPSLDAAEQSRLSLGAAWSIEEQGQAIASLRAPLLSERSKATVKRGSARSAPQSVVIITVAKEMLEFIQAPNRITASLCSALC